jgi:hypothetical protein
LFTNDYNCNWPLKPLVISPINQDWYLHNTKPRKKYGKSLFAHYNKPLIIYKWLQIQL